MILKVRMVREAGLYLPKVLLRLGCGGQWTPALRGLTDTGASHSLVTMDVVEALGWSREQVEAGPSLPIVGFGGGTQRAYLAKLDMEFSKYGDRGPLPIGPTTVALVPCRLPHNVQALLGQDDALRKLTFVQRNHGAQPYFSLLRPRSG